MMTMTMMKILIKGILQTPSKVLRDVTNKPKSISNSSKAKLLAPSSPSTIIISSPAKGDDDDDEEKKKKKKETIKMEFVVTRREE